MSTTHSGASCPVIPIHAVHPFRRMSSTSMRRILASRGRQAAGVERAEEVLDDLM